MQVVMSQAKYTQKIEAGQTELKLKCVWARSQTQKMEAGQDKAEASQAKVEV